VALFSGNEVFSKAIRKVTKSSYSHVALLLHETTKDPSDSEGWYVYSANGSASQMMAENMMPQVQLEKWTTTVPGYAGVVATRLLKFDAVVPTSQVITELVDKYIGMPYENQMFIMLKAMNRSNVESDKSANSAFCSEICYRFLAAAGVLEDTEVPENVWPKDFSDESDRLKLLGAIWEAVVLIKGVLPGKATWYVEENSEPVGTEDNITFSASTMTPDY